MGSLSIWHLMIVLAIVIAVFGTKKFRSVGSDLGATIREFREATGENREGEMQSAYQQVAQQPAKPGESR